MTRRDAMRSLLLFLAESPLFSAPQEPVPQDQTVDDHRPPIDEMINVFDFEPLCKSNIPEPAYDYLSGGGWDEWTLRRNREAFGQFMLLPRYLREVDEIDLSLTLFGQQLSMPILVAPTGSHSLFHADGETETARGAGAGKALMVVSSSSSYPLEKIGGAATGPLWFQLYTASDMPSTRERVQRAHDAGCQAICFTIDTPYAPPRERDMRYRVDREFTQRPARRGRRGKSLPRPYGLEPRLLAFLNWSFLDELRGWVKVPLLVKGILTSEDALLAVEHGADGVVVSNHGGRYLDSVPSTIEMLPEIVEAVGGKVPVLIDGGFRRGTDVLKALALGARAVLVGRPPLWGLGAFGASGVQRVLEILRKELAWAMGLAGRANLASIDRSLVRLVR